MTDEEIEVLCAEATPGPWYPNGGEFPVGGWWRRVEYVPGGLNGDSRFPLVSCQEVHGGPSQAGNNVAFIAAARTLVPELLARARDEETINRALTKTVDICYEDLAKQAERIRLLEQERDRLRARATKLREAMAELLRFPLNTDMAGCLRAALEDGE